MNVTVASGEQRSIRLLATVPADRLTQALTPAEVTATVDDADAPVRTLAARTMFVSEGARK